MQPSLTVIMVTYHGLEAARRCLKSLVEATSHGSSNFHCAQIIVVDSASGDGTPEQLASEFPQIESHIMTENRGFSAGVNQGLRRATGDLVLVLNPDTVVSYDLLDGLAGYMADHHGVAAAGPRIIGLDGHEQPSGAAFPSISEEISKQWSPLLRFFGRRYSPRAAAEQATQIDWISGACMMIRRSVIQEIHGFDEDFFLYWEEVDWCRRARINGWEVHYVPELQVQHEGGISAKSDGEVEENGCLGEHFVASRQHYFTKHHGPCYALLVEFVHTSRRLVRSLKLRCSKLGGRA